MLAVMRFCHMLCFSVMVLCLSSYAGFLEMPEIVETPELEEKSLLLDMDIPNVREREPDPQAGPRLNVKEFRIQGLVEYPKLGITRDEIIKRVEAIRFEMMEEGKLLDSGYTVRELSAMSDLVSEIEEETVDKHVTPSDVQRLVFLVREQKRRRGITVGMIEEVADTITTYYRERGFILAKAYIPEQEVRDGIVSLTLLLGALGDVEVDNNKRISPKVIKRAFSNQITEPVTSWRVEESLYLVNDLPGVAAQGFFVPGSQVGDTTLRVNVREEQAYSANVRLDNHGSESTSKNRAYADVFWHNPSGRGDELYAAVLNSYDPDNTTYYALRYSSLIGSPRLRAAMGFSSNDFVSRNFNETIGDTFFTGSSNVADVSVSYTLRRSRKKNYSLELAYMDVKTTLDDDTSTINNENVGSLSLGFNFDVLNEKRRQLYVGNVAVIASDVEQESSFSIPNDEDILLTYDVSVLSFLTFPFTDSDTRVLLRSAGQYIGDISANLNQMSLTGPNRARGFEVSGFQSNDGVFLGLDWIFNSPNFGGAEWFGQPLSQVLQPYLFVDAVYGVIHSFDAGGDETTGSLMNAGLGLKINHSGFSANVSYASVIRDDLNELQEETPERNVYFELQYRF